MNESSPASPLEDETGSGDDSPYECGELLGQGAMSAVHLAVAGAPAYMECDPLPPQQLNAAMPTNLNQPYWPELWLRA